VRRLALIGQAKVDSNGRNPQPTHASSAVIKT